MFRLFHHFILRHMLQDKIRTALTVFGVALGVAVVVAVQLTNTSSIKGFETALETVAGRTSVEIVGAGTGIDETRLPDLLWLREIGEPSPVIEGNMGAILGDKRTEAVRVLGIDILRDRPIRDYEFLGRDAEAQGESGEGALAFLEALTSDKAIVIPEKFARRHGLEAGSTLRLMSGDRVGTFTVTGLLKDEGPARVLDGNFVLMDIAAAQLAFDRLGRIDRIDVRLPEGADVQASLDAVAARLPAGLSAQRPSRRGEQVERMLAAFQMNLTALSWVALLVGLFLVYNTVTISVVARREEIGTLRSLGVTRNGIMGLFLGEAAALGTAGAILGLGLARILADGAVALTSTTVSTLYISAAAAPPELTTFHVVLGAAIGIPLSLLAAIVPAREAASVPPTAAMRGNDRLAMRFRLAPRYVAAPAVVLLAAGLLAQAGPVAGVPVFGYLAAFATVIGAALLVPAVIYGVARLSSRLMRRVLGVEGLLAHANLGASIPRLSISIGALAVSLAMLVAIAVMIGSFRDTVNYWIGQSVRGDLMIGPGYQPQQGGDHTLSPATVDLVTTHPGIADVDSFRNLDVTFEDRLIVLGAGDFAIGAKIRALMFITPSDGAAAMRDAVGRDEVIVSEAFQNRFGYTTGESITLNTPKGPAPFRIVGVYYDYSSDRGVVIMDRTTMTRHFGELAPTGLVAWVKEGEDPERVRQSLLDSVDEGHTIFAYTNRALRQEVLRIFDSTFAITYALEAIAIIVAMLGVAGTLLTLVIERRRELVLLRLIGASRRQIYRMVVVEAALLGAISQAIGLAVGFLLALILVYVINVQSFGWTIQFSVPVAFLAQATIAVIVATALSGLFPAARATQIVFAREE